MSQQIFCSFLTDWNQINITGTTYRFLLVQPDKTKLSSIRAMNTIFIMFH